MILRHFRLNRTASWWTLMTAEEAAAAWLVRRDSGRWRDDDARGFEAWLERSPEHAAAFARAEAAWSDFSDADAEPLLQSMRRSAAEARPEPRDQRWRAVAAASAAVIVLGAAFWFGGGGRLIIEAPPSNRAQAPASMRAELSRRGEADYMTVRGQRADVTLPDGTRVTLNTDSALDVAFERTERVVRLLRGQAFFDVAHDADHPFIVEAADRRITALGTQFDVRLDAAALQVLLVQGRVRVDRQAGTATAAAPAVLREEVELTPGEQLTIALGAPQLIAAADVETATAWRRGLVQFNDAPLEAAVAELNRYAPEPLVIRDPEVAAMRISGVFRTGDPERFARTIGELLPVQVRQTETGERQLVRAPSP